MPLDGDSLTMHAESTAEEMKRFVRFSEQDELLLARFLPVAAPHFRHVALEFYDRIREHQEAHAVFTGEEQIERLKQSLVRWMERVFRGPYNDAVFEEAAKVGRVHVRLGLPQRYMFTSMSLLRVAFARIADEHMGSDARATREAISRALDLQLVTMVGAYQDDSIARLQDVERLRQNEKLAAIGTLVAGLAHEIRNPLNGAQLHVTFLERQLRKKNPDPDAMEALRVVRDEIKRLSALLSEFLDFARPMPLELRETSLSGLCSRVLELMGPVAKDASVAVESELPSVDLVLYLDRVKMEQVLINLIQNAVEAMKPEGGGTLTLRVRRTPKSAVLEVEDDGPGIPGQGAPIFDPFFSTKPAGTGLGLSIAHKIVTDHEGSIDVESRPGKTSFSITLPLRTLPDKER